MKCLFIHGTGGSPNEAFFPWCRNELEKKGIQTAAPSLPSADVPDLKGWTAAVLEECDDDEALVFVGRSLGGTLIPHLLNQPKIRAKAAFSIAAPITDLGWENLKAFFATQADYAMAPQWVDHYYHWYSDDDPFVPLNHGKEFQERLGGEMRVFEGYSHFYNEEFPELIEEILKINKG